MICALAIHKVRITIVEKRGHRDQGELCKRIVVSEVQATHKRNIIDCRIAEFLHTAASGYGSV